MKKIYLISYFVIALAIICFFVFDSDKKSSFVEIARNTSNKFYEHYNRNETDSMVSLLSSDFFESTSVSQTKSYIDKHITKDGKILSVVELSSKETKKITSNNNYTEVIIEFNVEYSSGNIYKETNVFEFKDNHDLTGKIYSHSMTLLKK